MDEVLLLSSCATFCFIDTWYIFECISWYYFLYLATSNFSWLTQAFTVVLDVLYLLDHSFSVKFALIFSDCLECKFFLLYRLFSFYACPSSFSSSFKTCCFLLLFLYISSSNVISFITWFLQMIVTSTVVILLVHISFLSNWTFLLSFIVST